MNTILVILQQFEAVKDWIGINYTKYLLRALNYPQPECKWLNEILSCTQLQAMNRPEGSVHFLSGLRAIIIFSPTGKVRFLDTWYLIETFSIIQYLKGIYFAQKYLLLEDVVWKQNIFNSKYLVLWQDQIVFF